MGKCPEGLTLERIDNDKGYYKENCCYATRTVQARNKRLDKKNTTGVPGVNWHKKSNKYHTSIHANNKQYHIGLFNTLEEATAARKQAEQIYWDKT